MKLKYKCECGVNKFNLVNQTVFTVAHSDGSSNGRKDFLCSSCGKRRILEWSAKKGKKDKLHHDFYHNLDSKTHKWDKKLDKWVVEDE